MDGWTNKRMGGWIRLKLPYICLGIEYYVTEKASAWTSIHKDCRLATPEISINDNGHFVLSGEDIKAINNMSELANTTVWTGHFMTYGNFRYIGRYNYLPVNHQSLKY